MGTFGGHLIPGLGFLLMSLWSAYNSYKRYFKAQCGGPKFMSSTCYLFDKFPKFPLESIIKVIAGICGLITFIVYDNGDISQRNAFHMTMTVAFIIQACTEILLHYKFRLIPFGFEYFCSILALFLTLFLMLFHTLSKSSLDMHVHLLLTISLATCCFTALLESFNRYNLTVTLARSFCMLVFGTWIIHVGFILYPPLPGLKKWTSFDQKESMMITLFFSWHFIFDFICIYLIGSFVFLMYRRNIKFAELSNNLLESSSDVLQNKKILM